MRKAVPVLYYHRVNEVDRRMAVRPALFLRQMEHLRKRGWHALGIPELLAFLKTGELPEPRCLMITFDDGYLDNWSQAFPILRRTGMKAIIFLITDWIRDAGEPRPLEERPEAASSREPRGGRTLSRAMAAAWRGDVQDFLRVSEVRAMAESGLVEFGSHTRSHRPCFSSGRIQQFMLTASPHWTKQALAGGDLRPGVPLYEWASAVTVPCYQADPEVRERMVEFMDRQGGLAAVQAQGKEFWRERLLSAAEQMRPERNRGSFETLAQAETRIGEELAGSRSATERISGRPCLALCWPWGHTSDLGVRLAGPAGYQAGLTTQTGAVCQGDEAFLLPRLRVSGRTSEVMLAAMLEAVSHPLAAKLTRAFSKPKTRRQRGVNS